MKHVLIFIFLLAVCLTECRPTKLPVKDQYDAEVKLPWEADSSPVEDNHHVLHPAEVQARNSRNQLAPEKRAANTTSSETLPSVSDSSHLEVTFNRTTNISTIWIIKEDGQIGATIPIVNGTIMLPLPTSSALTTIKTSGDIKSTSLTSRAAVSVNDSHAKTHIVTVTVTANTSTFVSIESLSTTSTATANIHNGSITPSNIIKPALNQSISATLIPPVSATPIANQSLILSNLTSSQPTATKQQPVSLNSTTTPSIQFGNGTRTNSTSSYLQSTASVVPNNPNGTHSALQSHSPLNSLATVNSSFVTDTSSNTESTSRFSPFSTSTGIVEQTDLPESKTTEIIHSNSATDFDSPTDGADNEQQHHNSESSYVSATSQTESSVVPTMIPPAISASNTMDSQSNRNVILQTVSGLMFVIGLFDWIYFTTLCTICGIASSAMISASKKISKSTFDHPEQIAGNKAILVIVSFILVLLVRIAINLPYAYILIPWFTFTNKFIERVVVNYIHWIIFGLNIAVFTPFFVATFALWTRKSSYPAPTGTNPSIQILPIIPVVITLPPTFFDQTETPKISPNTLITSINAVIRSKKDCVSETIVHIFIAFNYSKEVEPGESSLENLIYEVIVKKLVSLNDYNPLKSSQNTHIELLRKMLRVEQDGGIGNIGLDSEQSLQTLSSEESRIEGEDSILIDKAEAFQIVSNKYLTAADPTVMFIDPDIVVHPTAIAETVKVMGTCKETFAIGGYVDTRSLNEKKFTAHFENSEFWMYHAFDRVLEYLSGLPSIIPSKFYVIRFSALKRMKSRLFDDYELSERSEHRKWWHVLGDDFLLTHALLYHFGTKSVKFAPHLRAELLVCSKFSTYLMRRLRNAAGMIQSRFWTLSNVYNWKRYFVTLLWILLDLMTRCSIIPAFFAILAVLATIYATQVDLSKPDNFEFQFNRLNTFRELLKVLPCPDKIGKIVLLLSLLILPKILEIIVVTLAGIIFRRKYSLFVPVVILIGPFLMFLSILYAFALSFFPGEESNSSKKDTTHVAKNTTTIPNPDSKTSNQIPISEGLTRSHSDLSVQLHQMRKRYDEEMSCDNIEKIGKGNGNSTNDDIFEDISIEDEKNDRESINNPTGSKWWWPKSSRNRSSDQSSANTGMINSKLSTPVFRNSSLQTPSTITPASSINSVNDHGLGVAAIESEYLSNSNNSSIKTKSSTASSKNSGPHQVILPSILVKPSAGDSMFFPPPPPTIPSANNRKVQFSVDENISPSLTTFNAENYRFPTINDLESYGPPAIHPNERRLQGTTLSNKTTRYSNHSASKTDSMEIGRDNTGGSVDEIDVNATITRSTKKKNLRLLQQSFKEQEEDQLPSLTPVQQQRLLVRLSDLQHMSPEELSNLNIVRQMLSEEAAKSIIKPKNN